MFLHSYTGRKDIARKYTEAAELIFQATLTRFNNEEEALKKITRAENLAEEASGMAAGKCKNEFQ